MSIFKRIAVAGVFAISTGLGSSASADAIGCTSDGTTAQEIAALEQVIAALEQWISNRTPADPNYATITSYLTTVEEQLAITIAGKRGIKLPFSIEACAFDVSPA